MNGHDKAILRPGFESLSKKSLIQLRAKQSLCMKAREFAQPIDVDHPDPLIDARHGIPTYKSRAGEDDSEPHDPPSKATKSSSKETYKKACKWMIEAGGSAKTV